MLQYNIQLTKIDEANACLTGCDLFKIGGSQFCECACVSTNNQIGFVACKAGCELALSCTPRAPAVNMPKNSSQAIGEMTATQSTTTTATIVLNAVNSTATTLTAKEAVATAHAPAVCGDNNAAAAQYFSELMGTALTCRDLWSAGGCSNAQFQTVVTKYCMVTCKLCTPSTATTPDTTSPPSGAGRQLDNNGSHHVESWTAVGASIGGVALVIAAAMYLRRRQGHSAVNNACHSPKPDDISSFPTSSTTNQQQETKDASPKSASVLSWTSPTGQVPLSSPQEGAFDEGVIMESA